jgi:DNA polymerase III subunit delta
LSADKQFPQNMLIWAGDSRFLEETSSAWVAQWGGADGAVNLAAAGLDPGALTMELNTLPMWSERQVVRLRQAESAAEDLVQALTRYLERPAPSAALLVEYTGDLAPKPAPARWKAVMSLVESVSCAPRSAKEYLSRRLRAEGFTIEPAAADALEEWACGELGRLVSALDLLCLFKLEEKRITSDDLDSLLGTGGTPREWDLQDAFLRGDRRTFLDLLQRIEGDPDSVPLVFVGMLSKQVRSLLLMHGYEARGLARREIPPKDLGFNHPFPAQKLLAVAGKWPERRVRAALGALFELDLALKGDPGPPWSTVERHLLKLMPA